MDITSISALIAGVIRNTDISSNTLVVKTLKVKAGAPAASELTQAILDKLITISGVARSDGKYDASNIVVAATPSNYTSAGTSAEQHLAGIDSEIGLKAPIASPTFTGTVSGISKSMVGLGNVDNTSDASKPVSTAQQTALDFKAPLASPTFTGTVSGISKSMVGLGNVDNTSDANKPISTATQTALNAKADLTDGKLSPSQIPAIAITETFVVVSEAAMLALTAQTGDVAIRSDESKTYILQGSDATILANWVFLQTPASAVLSVNSQTGVVVLSKSDIGLGNVDNTSDANKPVSTATQTALDFKAPLASPTFTGTVSGISKSMVGLGNVDNTSDANKPVSTATQTALDFKANLASPTFTGTVSGITKSMVGLGNVDNTADSVKAVASAALLQKSIVAGEAMAANTSFAVRLAMAGETAARSYKADKDASVSDKFYVCGIALSTGAVIAGGATSMVVLGTHILGSSDAHFSSGDIGKPVFLLSSGAFSVTAPTATSEAVCRIGIVEDVDKIFVNPAVIGVN